MNVIYKICAQTFSIQNKKTLFIIQVLGKTEQLARTANELAADPIMLKGFCPQDVLNIGYTAGMEQAQMPLK